MEPATPYDAKGLLKAAIRDDDPVLFFEHKLLSAGGRRSCRHDDYIVPIGQAIVRRPGSDLTIVTFGAMVHVALEAAEALAKSRASTPRSLICACARAARFRCDPHVRRENEQGHRPP